MPQQNCWWSRWKIDKWRRKARKKSSFSCLETVRPFCTIQGPTPGPEPGAEEKNGKFFWILSRSAVYVKQPTFFELPNAFIIVLIKIIILKNEGERMNRIKWDIRIEIIPCNVFPWNLQYWRCIYIGHFLTSTVKIMLSRQGWLYKNIYFLFIVEYFTAFECRLYFFLLLQPTACLVNKPGSVTKFLYFSEN